MNIIDKDFNLHWEMTSAEKNALYNILNDLRPSVSIEIGTRFGGSLQVISRFSETVYSFDIDESVKKLKSKFKNVEFIIGDSMKEIPVFLSEFKKTDKNIEFILIDGDHSQTGIKTDIDNILKIIPKKDIYVMMHDSFNPYCRQGIINAKWHECPYVHDVQIDFIHGIFSPTVETDRCMWGGFALALLKPQKRDFNIEIKMDHDITFNQILKISKHRYINNKSLFDKVKTRIINKLL